MKRRRLILGCVLVLAVSGGRGAAHAQVTIAGKPYEKLATRAATRQAMIGRISGLDVSWGPWHILSPFDQPEGATVIDKTYPPEDELPRMKAGGPGPDLGAAY